jgi:hypothetical protein
LFLPSFLSAARAPSLLADLAGLLSVTELFRTVADPQLRTQLAGLAEYLAVPEGK